MVIDCPSGRGKSLAGIALRSLDPSCNNGQVADMFNVKLRVAHIVWDKAIGAQAIYRPLHLQQESDGVYVDSFYPRARELQRNAAWIPVDRKSSAYSAYIWENFLQFLFVKTVEGPFDLTAFKSKHGLLNRPLILFLDEVPTDPVDVELVVWVRDLVRFLPGVLVILAGTNSKAANTLPVRLVSGEASANDFNREKPLWSFFVTRLPNYNVNLSSFLQQWERCKAAARKNSVIEDVVRVIQNSMNHGGNPRLINFAIEALEKSLSLKTLSFLEWHKKFAAFVAANKFFVARWSEVSSILIGQANLLLSASVHLATADIVLNRHFANRALPNSEMTGTRPGCGANDCGSWLRIADNPSLGVGLQLFYEPAPDQVSYGWQTTVFPKAASDPLLYLGCCFPQGYFASPMSLAPEVSYPAYRIAQVLWSHNAIGNLNFQNLEALTNSGAFLEVATSLAIINAAAVSPVVSENLSQFLLNFLQQMCIDTTEITKVGLQSEPAFLGYKVPKFIFPATDRSVPNLPKELFGMLHRTANGEKIDIFIKYPFGSNSLDVQEDEIHFECKYWEKAGLIDDMCEIARKLIRKRGAIAVSVHRKCHDYWGNRMKDNFEKLTRKLQDSEVGKMICIKEDGAISTCVVSSKPGTLVVVQVGEGWKPSQTLLETFSFAK